MAKRASTKTVGGRGVRVVDWTQERSAAKAAERAGLSVPAPIGFERLVGQDRAVGVLEAVLASGSVPHAWVFHGPRGVGKFTTAVSFAAALLDPSTTRGLSGRVGPDPDSPVQALLGSGTHPDLHVVRKELARWSRETQTRGNKLTTIPVDVLREFFLEPAARAASMRGGLADKVFIIDEAELLDRGQREGQNAILKTLEEPPAGTVIVLVTTSEERLLPTIRSRSQRVAFTPLDDRAIGSWFAAWCEENQKELSQDERSFTLAFADGAPGRAVAAVENGLYAWHTALAPMLAQADAGRHPAELGSAMHELVEEWAKAEVAAGEKIGENRSKEAATHAGAGLLAAVVAARYRAMMRGSGAGSGGGTAAAAAERGARAVEVIARCESMLAANVNGLFVWETLAAGLSEPLLPG